MPYKKQKENPINFGEGTGSSKKVYNKFGDDVTSKVDPDYTPSPFPHDKGYNVGTDKYGKTVSPGGNVYTYDEAGKQAYAEDQKEQFGVRGRKQIEESWSSYMEDAPKPKTPKTGGSGMGAKASGDAQFEASMKSVEAMAKSTGSGSKTKTKSNYQRGNKNYKEAVELGTHEGDSHLSWRQKRRLRGGGAKSDRQLKRLKRQEARKAQRAKNRRERGWGGFGWNRPR